MGTRARSPGPTFQYRIWTHALIPILSPSDSGIKVSPCFQVPHKFTIFCYILPIISAWLQQREASHADSFSVLTISHARDMQSTGQCDSVAGV